jgi:hypothetical protein
MVQFRAESWRKPLKKAFRDLGVSAMELGFSVK